MGLVQYKVITKAIVSCKQAQAGNCKWFSKVPVCFVFSMSALFPNCRAVHLWSYLDWHLSPGSRVAVSIFSLCVYLQARPHWRSGSERVHMWWVMLTLLPWQHTAARARAHGRLHLPRRKWGGASCVFPHLFWGSKGRRHPICADCKALWDKLFFGP